MNTAKHLLLPAPPAAMSQEAKTKHNVVFMGLLSNFGFATCTLYLTAHSTAACARLLYIIIIIIIIITRIIIINR